MTDGDEMFPTTQVRCREHTNVAVDKIEFEKCLSLGVLINVTYLVWHGFCYLIWHIFLTYLARFEPCLACFEPYVECFEPYLASVRTVFGTFVP